MRFAVFGAGGLGAYYGARLVEAGYEVSFIARGPHLEAMQKNGLKVISPVGDVHLEKPQVTDQPADIGEVDVVIIAVKSWHVAEIIPVLGPLLGDATVMLPFLNGVDAPDQLASTFGEGSVLGGLSRIFSEIESPGVIRHLNPAAYIECGELNGERSSRVEVLADVFRGAGIETEASDNIRCALWQKLLLVGSWAGLGALSQSSLGVVCDQPELRSLVDQAMDEGIAVGGALGYPLPDNLKQQMWDFYHGVPHDTTASLMRDILSGRPSELDAWNGAIVRFGDQVGVPTPVHQFTYDVLLPMERRARGQL
ncbi:MAG: 2-dehydropantoate 2-reductase [Arenicellales bacterium]|nr:2-dehydropantoate 2-reductase [Arenicellales bacterium]